MPRLVAATPKYRHHRASGQAVVTIAGKDHYLGPWKSKASTVEYDRLIGEWLAAGRPTARPPATGEITVMEVVRAFWRHAQAFYVKNGRMTGTADNYKPALALLKTRYGHTAASDFGPLALKSLRASMVESGHSRRYINENVHRIRKTFRWAASEQLIPALIPQALATVEGLRKGHTKAKDHAPVSVVDNARVEATLPHLPRTVADMVRLQRLTGARPGEIIAMRPADIDRSGEVWTYTPAEHKTEHHNHRRIICIGPKAQAVLLPYLLRDAESHCFQPADSEKQRRREVHAKRTTPLSCGNRPGTNRKRRCERAPGVRYSNDSYRRAISRACIVAFMPVELRRGPKDETADQRQARRTAAAKWRAENVWFPHQLRHTAATDIRKRFGLESAQATLGHTRLEVTQIYAEKNQDLAERVAREVG